MSEEAEPNFRKITARDTEYISMNARLESEIEGFREYLKQKPGTTETSGMPDSYARYLVRLAIIIENFYEQEVSSVLNPIFFKQLNEIRSQFVNDFNQYNLSESRYPNATINDFNDYFRLIQSAEEKREDSTITFEEENLLNSNNIDNQLPNGPQEAKSVQNKKVPTYPRNSLYSYAAKKRAKWLCEIDSSHRTFDTRSGKQYMESHHIIPMSAQPFFKYSLDVPENIVSLCPNCHMKIHYADSIIVKNSLEFLHELRINKLTEFGIPVDLEDLYKFYNL